MVLPIDLPPSVAEVRAAPEVTGDRLWISGVELSAPWVWKGPVQQPQQLWLTLEVLESYIGFQRIRETDRVKLNWLGQTLILEKLPKRSLDNHISLDLIPWLEGTGLYPRYQSGVLELQLPQARIKRLRRRTDEMRSRLVFDLTGPALIQQQGSDLLLGIHSNVDQQTELCQLGFRLSQERAGLRLIGNAENLRVLSLRNPWRLVLDKINSNKLYPAGPNLPLFNPIAQKLLRRGLKLDHRRVIVGVKPLSVTRVGINFSSGVFAPLPLTQIGSQQGLLTLAQLAAPSRAVVAINGGFFNRTRQLPLGALKRQGTWLSGPILNRGAIGWSGTGPLRFGRLKLHQELRVQGGQRWQIGYLNSGFVQSGLSRYTSAWGPRYQALSAEEQALLVRNNRVVYRFTQSELDRGVPIGNTGDLVVSRGGVSLPAEIGDCVSFHLQVSNPLGDLPHVLGAGPLLLQEGHVVLAGQKEGFSPAFLEQAAPRSVVAQDAQSLWLAAVTNGGSGSPTLLETALALLQLKLSDALNLDGGSSTALLLADRLLVTGQGVAPRIQNALGLVLVPQK